MILYFLSAEEPLTKRFEQGPSGLIKHPYPHTFGFTSHPEEVTSLRAFHDVLIQHAAKAHCLLKGQLTEELRNQSRAGKTDPNTDTQWICLDIDGLPLNQVEEFINLIPHLRNTSYIVQHSASSGIDKERGLSVHLFFLLEAPVSPSRLKTWLMYLNISIDLLKQNLRLTKSGVAMRYALDITVCQNDKLIYIAPPILGKGLSDSIQGKRIQLIRKKNQYLNIPLDAIPTLAEVDSAVREHIAVLRERARLPKLRRLSQRHVRGNCLVASNPSACEVTGVKTVRGFTYLNLGGGDSWGYYYPEGKPEILFNFKGEPDYLLREVCPDYYETVVRAMSSATVQRVEKDVHILAFLDTNSSTYYRGTYDRVTDELEIKPARTLKMLNDFLVENGEPVPETIKEWNMEFRFDDPRHVDLEARFINTYQPTPYMAARADRRVSMPPTIAKIINHVCGGDDAVVEHFLNWIAVIFQKRIRTQTIWVFTGVPGTGKGLLMNYIMRPIFGPEYCHTKSMAEMEDQFNAYMEQCVMLMVDEANMEGCNKPHLVLARIKNNSTEPVINIRRMQVGHYMAPNYLNFIVSSNHPDPILVDPADRRFNVGRYQPTRIELSEEEFEEIEKELGQFAVYLASRTADERLARTPLDNEARTQLIHIGRNAADVVADALLSGNLQFFIDQLPTDEGLINQSNAKMSMELPSYRAVMEECMLHEGQKYNLSRDQMRVIFEFCVGGMSSSPHKFASYLKHHNIHLKRMRKNGDLVQGMEVTWNKIALDMSPRSSGSGTKVVPLKKTR